ncbi:MAG: hypothetical protein J6A46_05380 [Clostridia bacterium]|nr:hypothetical protein [Clostridia bacterium]
MQARQEERGFPDGTFTGRKRARGDASSTKYLRRRSTTEAGLQLQARQEERGFPDGTFTGRKRARENASSTKYCAANPFQN